MPYTKSTGLFCLVANGDARAFSRGEGDRKGLSRLDGTAVWMQDLHYHSSCQLSIFLTIRYLEFVTYRLSRHNFREKLRLSGPAYHIPYQSRFSRGIYTQEIGIIDICGGYYHIAIPVRVAYHYIPGSLGAAQYLPRIRRKTMESAV